MKKLIGIIALLTPAYILIIKIIEFAVNNGL